MGIFFPYMHDAINDYFLCYIFPSFTAQYEIVSFFLKIDHLQRIYYLTQIQLLFIKK